MKQVQAGIEKKLSEIPEKDRANLAKIMAREALEKFSDDQAFENHGKRIYVSTEKYIFRDPVKNITETISSPYDFWVKKTDKGIEFDLIGEELGKGSFNTVYKTAKFEIQLLEEKHMRETMQVRPAILRRSTKITTKNEESTQEMREAVALVKSKFPDPEQRKELGFDLPEDTDRTTKKGTVSEASALEVFQGDYFLWCQGPFVEESEKLEVLGSMARALNALHEKGIVHGDFKPENIFIGKDGRAHLGDFDMACEVGSEKSKKLCGTPTYVDAWTLTTEDVYRTFPAYKELMTELAKQ